MKLSAPIFILKQQARSLARQDKIPLNQALKRIARREGFSDWSLLAAKSESDDPVATLLARLQRGDLALLGSRPGQGKTLLGLGLALKTVRDGNRAMLFTLDFSEPGMYACLRKLGQDPDSLSELFMVDHSDLICADYIAFQVAAAPVNTLIIIDYLQLLDQNRRHPEQMHQVRQLKALAEQRQLIIVCLSQIDRRFDDSSSPCPGVDDVRLPNPVDLGMFNKTCFLHRGAMEISTPVAAL